MNEPACQRQLGCARARAHSGKAAEGLGEEGDLAAGKSTAAEPGAWIVFEDEAGQSMTPPRARTWGRIGQTPVVRVFGLTFLAADPDGNGIRVAPRG